jgi:shikimate dehydrogenase
MATFNPTDERKQMTSTELAGRPTTQASLLDSSEGCVEAGTRLMGLLGADIRHADLAFSFNNRLLSYWGRQFVYVPYSVSSQELKDAVEGIRALDILACNVTFPHKVAIIQHLDEIDATTRRMGSVNLVVNREGRLWGYNTDSMGFMDALRATGLMDELDSALIYGAGGAGRALATALANAGMLKIWLYDVIEARSHEVQSRLSHNGCRVCAVAPEDLHHLRPALIVNATPLGRGEQAHMSPLTDLRTAEDARLFFDLNYSPPRSRFLRQAESLGVPAENGLRMMCYQAKRSIDTAVGREVPFEWFYTLLKHPELEEHMVHAGPAPLRP